MGNDRNRPDPLASASHLDWHGTLAKAVGPFLVRVFSERRAFRKALMVYEPLLLLSIFGVPATLNILQVATVTFTALWGRCHCHLILQRKEQAARFRPCKEVSDPGLGRAKAKSVVIRRLVLLRSSYKGKHWSTVRNTQKEIHISFLLLLLIQWMMCVL